MCFNTTQSPPVYLNDRLIVYALTNNQTIARLAAQVLILELQHAESQTVSTGLIASDKKTIKQQIIGLSPHTAFIGIEKRVNAKYQLKFVLMIKRKVSLYVSMKYALVL